MPSTIDMICQQLSNIGLIKQAPNNSNQDKNSDTSIFNNSEEVSGTKYEFDTSSNEAYIHSCINNLKNDINHGSGSAKQKIFCNVGFSLLDAICSIFGK